MPAAVRRILFVVHRLAHGGAELQVAALAERFVEQGRDVAIVVTGEADPDFHERLTSVGIEVSSLHSSGLLRSTLRLMAEVRRWQPDVIHAHGFQPNLAARLAHIWTRGVVLICTTHNLGESEYPFNKRYWTRRYRWSDRFCTLTTNVCNEGLQRYIAAGAIPRDKGAVVPNGIDVDRFRPDPASRELLRAQLGLGDAPTLIAVGRITEGKGYETLLDAFDQLGSTLGAILLLVGTGSMDTEIRRRAAELQSAERIRFLGPRDDIPELLNAADAYVMASWSEALPLVLLEASAVGLPIVATSVGGNADIVLHEKTGLLTPPKNTEALRSALDEMVCMPASRRAEMGASGRTHVVAEFSLERVVARWSTVYEELAGHGGSLARSESRAS